MSERERSKTRSGGEPHRVMLDPPEGTEPRDESAAPPEDATQRAPERDELQAEIMDLVARAAGGPRSSQDRRLVAELVTAALKLLPDGRDTGELKLVTAAVKELRYAYRVFGQYPEPHKVTIFGSARTPPEHPDYAAAVAFSRLMAGAGWMVITGAGDGIMKAGHEGPGAAASFGVAIRLPFETTANTVIEGNEKLINFRYFFTRKLMFLSQAEAVVCFPGGFGTMDETFETLTLIQTGKASMIPIVLAEGRGGGYWRGFDRFIREDLLTNGMISPEDRNLYHIAATPEDAAEHVLRFYRVYHSSRYVRDDLVIRLRRPLPASTVEALNEEFAVLVKQGVIEQRGALEQEDDHLDLPRLVFTHTRHKYGLVRALIDRVNDAPED